MCDSYVEVFEGSLHEAIVNFTSRHEDYLVVSEAVWAADQQKYNSYPALFASEGDANAWWEYTMILWPEC